MATVAGHFARFAVAALVIAGGLYLAWESLAFAVVRDAVVHRPEAALSIEDRDARALAWTSDTLFAAAKTPADFDRAADLARRSLLRGPLEATPLRVLGMYAERQGRRDQAVRLMSLAGQRTRRDVETQNWLFGAALQAGRYGEAFDRADVLLRRDPDAGRFVFPAVLAALDDRRAVAPLASRLAAEPPWGEDLIAEVVAKASDLTLARSLVERLETAQGRPPSDAVATAMVTRLLKDRDYRAAKAAWSELFADGAGGDALIYDAALKGSAKGPPPFNWRLAANANASAEFTEDPQGVVGLYVQDRGAYPLNIAEQLLTLPPGRYVLRGQMRFDGQGPPNHPTWRIECADGPSLPLATMGQMGRAPGWRPFALAFEVPAQNCAGQWLRLKAAPRETFEPAQAWYAALSLAPSA